MAPKFYTQYKNKCILLIVFETKNYKKIKYYFNQNKNLF